MTSISQQITQNLTRVRQRLEAACARANRDPADVQLVAVTKYAEVEWVRILVEQGITELGESRPQQLVERAPEFGDSVHWHLIGHLQRNKARRILPLVSLIHSVDSFRLLSAIERLAEETDVGPRVLLEVNVAAESQKHGFHPDELIEGWQQIVDLERVEVAGLMCMAPHTADVEDARPYFRILHDMRDQFQSRAPDLLLPELSMGMSDDFEVAIEEGATIIRIGSSLYEGLAE